MLSDEEKKTIDKLKNGKKYTLVEIIRVFKKEGIENFRITRKEYLETILNLIEKQSKEIEELKGVRPEKLTGEAKRLFEAIMKIADERDELLKERQADKEKIEELIKQVDTEYIKVENIFNNHFEKENKDMQDYYIQKEATSMMQELSWIKGKIEELLKDGGGIKNEK